MNRNDFRNPLIKSGLVLLFVFLLISIVASSPADGFFGSTFALIAGIVRGILFLVALAIGLVFSIAILIGIFLMAVSFHSVDKAKALFEQLKTALGSLYCKFRSCCTTTQCTSETTEDSPPSHPAKPAGAKNHSPSDIPVSDVHTEQRLSAIETQLSGLQTLIKSIEQRSADLHAQVNAITFETLEEQLSAANDITAECSEKIEHQATIIESTISKMGALDQSFEGKLQALQAEVAALKEKTSIPDVVAGILSYIDLPADREQLTKKTEEAVARGLTYAQADEFFKKSLPAKVYKILGAHPRLTKDFIRSVKKKFV